jgi:hypothetical protein
MPTDAKLLQYCVKGPYRHGDGSYKFDVVIFEASPVQGGVAEVRGLINVHVDDYVVCRGAAEVLRKVADDLPGQILTPRGSG